MLVHLQSGQVLYIYVEHLLELDQLMLIFQDILNEVLWVIQLVESEAVL